jgi:hypothetical protein
MDECLDTELRIEKLNLDPATTQSCLNTKNTRTERLQVIKLPTNDLASNVQIPIQKHWDFIFLKKKYDKTRQHDSSK